MTTDQSNDPKAPSATAPWPRFPAAAYLLTLAAERLQDEAPTARDKFVADALVARTSTALGVEELRFCAALVEVLDVDAQELADHCRLVRGEYIATAPVDSKIAQYAAEARDLADELVRLANRFAREADKRTLDDPAPWPAEIGRDKRATLATPPEAGAVKS